MKKDTTAYGAERPAWDKADCSVRALATAAGVSYAAASVAFSAFGRQLRQGTPIHLSHRLHEQALGMRRIETAAGMSLGEFVKIAQTGRFVVHKKRHAFAIVNGVVHDWQDTSSERTTIVEVWKVTEETRAKLQRIEEALK